MIHTKLDILMNLTGTSNTALALSLAIVPSHLSRVRRGQRAIPKNKSQFLHDCAEYFASLPFNSQQKRGLAALLGLPHLPGDQATLAEHISSWMTKDEADLPDAEEQSSELPEQKPASGYGEPAVYLGTDGRREASLRFLTEVARFPCVQELLLYSDESMEWMNEPSFFAEWQKLCIAILKKGCQMTIVHTVDRPANEILMGIQGWLPLYTSGLIHPYYCPERQGTAIYHRTIFIAPKTAAITSQSVHGNTEGMPNLYITDPDAVDAFSAEYRQFLSACKPLMQIFATNTAEILNLLEEIETKPGSSYFYQPEVKLSVFFHENTGSFTHILCLGDEKPTPAGLVYLREIRSRLNSDPGYHLVLIPKPVNVNTIYLKEKRGTLVVNPLADSLSFFFNEPHMLAGMHDYLFGISAAAPETDVRKILDKVIAAGSR